MLASAPGWNFLFEHMSILSYIQRLFAKHPHSRNKGSVPYSNNPITVLEQINRLQADGLEFTNITAAEQELSNISYFRLSEYLNQFRRVDHRFQIGTSLDNALCTYYFDKQLRALIFQAIQSIEVALRTRMIQHISMPLGSFWFLDNANFKNATYYKNTLNKIRNEIGRTKEPFILEFYDHYASPDLPPVWKTLEVISFGTLSKLYENLADGTIKQAVANSFGVNKYKFFVSWIQSIAVLRNLCCHHNRVWNRNFVIHPQIPTRDLRSIVHIEDPTSTKLYNFLCILCYLEKQIHPNSSFASKLKELLKENPTIDITTMGFPLNWQNESLWTK